VSGIATKARHRSRDARAAATLAAAAAAYGLFEAQRVECVRIDVPIHGLPGELDELSILHLSDLHLGSVSLNQRALAKAVRFAAAAQPDLVAITGDLLARRSGEATLQRALRCLPARHGRFAVLGNVDVSDTRDPFSGEARVASLAPAAQLLENEAVELEIRGKRVLVAGAGPDARGAPAATGDADLRILLAHFPETFDDLPVGAFHLVLSGHVHGGQICVPYPGGKIRFGGFDLRPRYPQGTFVRDGATLVVSRGTGTTFVPFRFFARPEASLLVLRGAVP
jgi:predicted MPP superfamily phosphohydrolase